MLWHMYLYSLKAKDLPLMFLLSLLCSLSKPCRFLHRQRIAELPDADKMTEWGKTSAQRAELQDPWTIPNAR